MSYTKNVSVDLSTRGSNNVTCNLTALTQVEPGLYRQQIMSVHNGTKDDAKLGNYFYKLRVGE